MYARGVNVVPEAVVGNQWLKPIKDKRHFYKNTYTHKCLHFKSRQYRKKYCIHSKIDFFCGTFHNIFQTRHMLHLFLHQWKKCQNPHERVLVKTTAEGIRLGTL